LVSDDVIFDESFQAAIAATWQQYQDSLSLKPVASHIPDIDTHLEHTRTLEDVATTVEEGTPISSDSSESDIPAPHNSSNTINSTPNATSSINLQEGTPDHDTEKDESDHDHIDEDFSTSSHDSQLVPLESTLPEEPQPSPQIIDQGPFRISNRVRKLPAKFQYFHLANICLSEAYSTLDCSSPDAWLESVKAELKTLVDAKTFIQDTLEPGETSTPVMEIFKVKIKSDGFLDKLKTRLVVRGDLQNKS